MDKHRILVLTGVTGVGKDYLADAARQAYEVPTLNWGTLLGVELGANRDLMMSTEDPARIRTCQFRVCRKLVDSQPLVVTSHTIRQVGAGYGYDLELETQLNPTCYTFVTAPAELIQERVALRNERGERKSPELSAAEIERVQQVKLAAVTELAGVLACDLLVLNNIDEEFDANMHTLQDRIERLGILPTS